MGKHFKSKMTITVSRVDSGSQSITKENFKTSPILAELFVLFVHMPIFLSLVIFYSAVVKIRSHCSCNKLFTIKTNLFYLPFQEVLHS